MRLFFSAGEASGDAYGALLLQAIRESEASLSRDIAAIGGRRLREAGARLVADSSRWGAIGIVEALRVSPRVLRGFGRARRELSKGPPGVFVPIDFGFLNVRLARQAKRRGWRVYWFVPPGSWRRNRQGQDVAELSDVVVTPFPWSAEILRGMGARAFFLGHPLRGLGYTSTAGGFERESIAVLPGSRPHEVRANLRAIGPALEGFDRPIEVAVAPTLTAAEVQKVWERACSLPARFREADTRGVLLRSRAGIVCSGTATLEAALSGCPCVVVYRGSRLMELEYRIRRPKFRWISLPNILLEEGILAELIQWDATPERIRRELRPLLDEGPRREEVLNAFARIDALLGPTFDSEEAVRLLKRLAEPYLSC